MIEQIKHRIFSQKRVAGIELTQISEGAFHINCLVLESKKGKAVIADTYYNLKSLKELEGKIPKFTPAALVMNGKGLIHKKTTSTGSALSSEILPGVNPADFLYQYFKLPESSDIAIIRKKVVEDILSQLGSLNIYVTTLSFAFYDINFVAEYINHSGEISTTQYQLDFNNKQIRHYRLNNPEEKERLVKPEINVGTEYVKTNFIIAYSAALKMLLGGAGFQSDVPLSVLSENQKRINQRTLLRAYSLTFLSIMLLLLLLNFFIYTHYLNKYNDLASQIRFSQQQTERFDSLKKSVESKKGFLSSLGWLNDNKLISYYADRIAATVPDSVTLSSLTINPSVLRSSFGTKQWSFQQDTILITGECNEPALLDRWINELQAIKNVSESKVSSYVFKKNTETGIFRAEVLLK